MKNNLGGKIMKRKMILFLCMVLCFTVFTGCGTKDTGGTKDPEPEEIIAETPISEEKVSISLGHIYSTNHNEAVALENLKNRLAEASDGRIEMTIFPNSQLGSEREMAEQVILGTLDMGLSDGPTWSNALDVPEIAVFGLPFLYNDIDGQRNVIENILIETASEMMVPAGVRPVFGFAASIRGALMKTKPIEKADDIVGIKMRVPEISMYVNTWENLGANATTTPWGEAYTAIQQGVVDGCEADPSTLFDANLYETTNYLSLTNHMGVVHIISMNEEKWQSIPKDLQDIFLKEADIVAAEQAEDRKITDGDAIKKMEEQGIVVNKISSEEIEKMAAKVQPIYDEFDEKYGLGNLIKEIRKLGM